MELANTLIAKPMMCMWWRTTKVPGAVHFRSDTICIQSCGLKDETDGAENSTFHHTTYTLQDLSLFSPPYYFTPPAALPHTTHTSKTSASLLSSSHHTSDPVSTSQKKYKPLALWKGQDNKRAAELVPYMYMNNTSCSWHCLLVTVYSIATVLY